MGPIQVINLTNNGISREESRTAAKWMAKAFADAPATPALTIFFGAAPYEDNREMHEAFWGSHLNRVAHTGILLGAKDDGGWLGFRCFFEPGKGRQPYVTDYRLDDDNQDWDRFLELAGATTYMNRIKEWGEKTSVTAQEIGLDTSGYFTTSIIVVDPASQRHKIGKFLDDATLDIVRKSGTKLFVRIHEYILSFYTSQGYRVLISPHYTLQGSEPFKVHFLLHEVE